MLPSFAPVACAVLKVSARLRCIKKEIPAGGKFTKCLLLASENWSLLLLAKINALVACLQMLAKTIRYPSIGVKKVMTNLALEYCKFDFLLGNFH